MNYFTRRALMKFLGQVSAVGAGPLLPAFQSFAQGQSQLIKRSLVVFTGDGFPSDFLSPVNGDLFANPYLQPLARFKSKTTIVNGLYTENPNKVPDPHAAATTACLAGALIHKNNDILSYPRKPSIDVVLADAFRTQAGITAPVPRVQLRRIKRESSHYLTVGHCFHGHDGKPLSFYSTAKQAFDSLLYGKANPVSQGGDAASAQQAQIQNTLYKKMIDVLQKDAENLSKSAPEEFKQIIENHQNGFAELEKYLEIRTLGNGLSNENTGDGSIQACEVMDPVPNFREQLEAQNADKALHAAQPLEVDAMFNIAYTLLSCDISRVIAFQMSRSGCGFDYHWVGGPRSSTPSSFHDINHSEYGAKGEERDNSRIVYQNGCRWHVSQMEKILSRLENTPDHNGTLLDNTLVIWTSEFGPGKAGAHDNSDMTYLLFGGANLGLQGGRRIDLSPNPQPTSDFLTSLAHKVGVDTSIRIGDNGNGFVGVL